MVGGKLMLLMALACGVLLSLGASNCQKALTTSPASLAPEGTLVVSCFRTCQEEFKAARGDEGIRYHDEMLACQDAPSPSLCLSRAAQYHGQILRSLATAHRVCVDACFHEQGQGAGGQ